MCGSGIRQNFEQSLCTKCRLSLSASLLSGIPYPPSRDSGCPKFCPLFFKPKRLSFSPVDIATLSELTVLAWLGLKATSCNLSLCHSTSVDFPPESVLVHSPVPFSHCWFSLCLLSFFCILSGVYRCCLWESQIPTELLSHTGSRTLRYSKNP